MRPSPTAIEAAQDLCRFVDESPTPHHAVRTASAMLKEAGCASLDMRESWQLESGKRYLVVQEGTLITFRLGRRSPVESGFRIVGAHTDSPNLRIKPTPDLSRNGVNQLAVDVYGGALTYTWFDRDLGLAGTVTLDDGSQRDFLIREPLCRVPSLAIHLNRDVEKGFAVNRQEHLPVYFSEGEGFAFQDWLASTCDVPSTSILSFDVSLFDTVPSSLSGASQEFVSAPRLDNLASSHAALVAFQAATEAEFTQVVCLYDHEEVGSTSAHGAQGTWVESVLRRITGSNSFEGWAQAVAHSVQISSDMAHAGHGNYLDKHDENHMPKLNAGPVIKINRNQRYATSAKTEALFAWLCQECDVPFQRFVNRSDLGCGSTIGPISAARLGIETVDVGNPMLAMHSIREMGGTADHDAMTRVLQAFLQKS